MVYYIVSGVLLMFSWCPCMAINVSVVLFFPLPSDQIGEGFLVCYFFLSFSSFICFLDVAMVWKGKSASVTTGSRDRTYVRE